MTHKQSWALFGCVLLLVQVAAAQEANDTRGRTPAQEVQQLRSEVNELRQDVRKLEARLADIEDLLRELARERQSVIAPEPAADTPLEKIQLDLSPADRPNAYETLPLGSKRRQIEWYNRVPVEVEPWIRPSFRPSHRYHWNTFPVPPSPSGL
jgi:hypothetical protein